MNKNDKFYRYKNCYILKCNNEWEQKWEEYRRKHGLKKYHIGDTPGFGDDITCQNQE